MPFASEFLGCNMCVDAILAIHNSVQCRSSSYHSNHYLMKLMSVLSRRMILCDPFHVDDDRRAFCRKFLVAPKSAFPKVWQDVGRILTNKSAIVILREW